MTWRLAWTIGLLVLPRILLARTVPALDGTWHGTVAVVSDGAQGTVTGAFGAAGDRITGTMQLAMPGASGPFAVAGRLHGARAALRGAHAAARFRWRARWDEKKQMWRGRMAIRDGKRRMRVRVTLARDGVTVPVCGNEYFASEVMPAVMEPVCASCHVPGGLAQAAAFRVAPGDPVATAGSALRMVDAADPPSSRLLAKPRGLVPHGGGVQIAAGSREEQVLTEWITLVTAPGCATGPQSPEDDSGSGLYARNCASCHGADARGTEGRPDIRCHRDVSDAVRNGRVGPAGTMPPFTLSDEQIARIQGYLLELCPVGSAGDELYASNCAGCHGVDAGGTSAAPSVRCATRVDDALAIGRGTRMPASPHVAAADVTSIAIFLDERCTALGRTGGDLYAGNCASCHGTTAAGGRNGLGVRGPDIRCTEAGDYSEKVRFGDDDMPAFPRLDPSDVTAIVGFVHGHFCPGG